MSKKYGLENTRQLVNRTWVVPKDQVEEFMYNPIDYQKLCADAVRSMDADKERQNPTKPSKKKKTKFFTIEL